MNSKVTDQHRRRAAYVYIRQSTIAQTRYHQESTERQYALRQKALQWGWSPAQIHILDRDLGLSGAESQSRPDFQTLMTDVSRGQVGVILALEASRLARSSLDWQHLIQICALTDTLVVDEDGCYDPADFNDGLLLGLKGTLAQAELHFLRARLQGGKLNKARKGELRFPLPVGFTYDAQQCIVPDPDQEVQGSVRLVFRLFRQKGSAYGVVHHFAQQGLRFPKRAYGGAWDGQLIWGRLTHERVLGLLKNPCYAGVYVFGRYRSRKQITDAGQIRVSTRAVPRDAWLVTIQDHHEGYIHWQEYLENQQILESNCTRVQESLLSGPVREGLALLHGLLLCAACGRRLTVRYQGNGGIYPTYECNWRRREGLSTRSCLSLRCDVADQAISKRVLKVLQPAQLEMATRAVEELEQRDQALLRQWQMRLEKTEYETQLAERRYQEVDPSNRLVAATLESRWNEALEQLEHTRHQYEEFLQREARATTPEQKARVLALAQDFPRLWNAASTPAKDRKRMLRLLIRDITVEKKQTPRQLILHIRWQGGACEDLPVELPQKIADRIRYPRHLIQRVRQLARRQTDPQIAHSLNQEGLRSPKGKTFTPSMVRWIRYRYQVPTPDLKDPHELTVNQVAQRFAVSPHVVYYWIERKLLPARRLNRGSPYWITLDADTQHSLQDWVRNSSRIQKQKNQSSMSTVGGAV